MGCSAVQLARSEPVGRPDPGLAFGTLERAGVATAEVQESSGVGRPGSETGGDWCCCPMSGWTSRTPDRTGTGTWDREIKSIRKALVLSRVMNG